MPIYKAGDKTKCDNYRDTTLFSMIGKVYERILNNELLRCIEVQIEENTASLQEKKKYPVLHIH